MMAKEYGKLRGRIVERFGSQSSFADAMGITEQTVTNKLNGKREFSQGDIIEWCNALEISAELVGDYFFAHKLSNS